WTRTLCIVLSVLSVCDLLCVVICLLVSWFFFFQAEDGIRDATVTGVQTCALPIYLPPAAGSRREAPRGVVSHRDPAAGGRSQCPPPTQRGDRGTWPHPGGEPGAWPENRSEERRVGKGCREERAAAQYE